MKGFWGGLLLLVALTFTIAPAVAGEVELQQTIEELKARVAALEAEKSIDASSVESAIDEYLSSLAAEGSGEVAGYLGGNFGLRSDEGDFKLNVSGGVVFDAMFYEPNATPNNTFGLDLVRINLSGQVGDGWKFKLQPEFMTDGVQLRDAYIQTRTSAVFGETGSEYFDGIAWTFGQFKPPMSMSALTNDYAIDTITRPIIVRAVANPSRDIGIKLSNTIANDMLYWAIAVMNGENSSNETNEFSYWGRVVVSPFVNDEGSSVENMHFGLSFGTRHTEEGCTPEFETAGGGPYGMVGTCCANYSNFYPCYEVRGRETFVGFDFVWWMQQYAVKFEAMYVQQELRRDDYLSSMSSSSTWEAPYYADHGSEAATLGGYLALNYMVTGEDWSETPDKGLELVLQGEWGQIDPGGAAKEGDYRAVTLGANWYFSKNARVMLNWVATDLGDDTARSSMEDGRVRGGGLEHTLLLRLQLTF